MSYIGPRVIVELRIDLWLLEDRRSSKTVRHGDALEQDGQLESSLVGPGTLPVTRPLRVSRTGYSRTDAVHVMRPTEAWPMGKMGPASGVSDRKQMNLHGQTIS